MILIVAVDCVALLLLGCLFSDAAEQRSVVIFCLIVLQNYPSLSIYPIPVSQKGEIGQTYW